jgi:hypothetical protein
MTPFPIETAPKGEVDHEPVPISLWCPDEGGSHAGIWFAGVWRLHADIEHELDPTHCLRRPQTWWSIRACKKGLGVTGPGPRANDQGWCGGSR